ncbi:MAG: hypothetical protein CSA51_01570 [Gammaproteobacteria bacterium]|nr:MAG: hypothetical protein CSA51_01570 [Gammaproteobacteria bacterium]
MSRSRYRSSQAIAHVLGKSFVPVIVLLIVVAWFTDSGLELFKYFFQEVICDRLDFCFDASLISVDVFISFCVFVLSSIVLMFFWFESIKSKHSDKFKPIEKDNHKDERKILFVTLSTYHSRGFSNKEGEYPPGYTYDKLIENMDSFPKILQGAPISDLRCTDFQCNWLPLLQAINNYPSVEEIIVFTTSGKRGSFRQFDGFKDFVSKYYEDTGREITITPYNHPKLLTDSGYKKKYPEGLSADDMLNFAKVVLHVFDNVIAMQKKNKSINKDPNNMIAIDVTGGMASMSAVMAAISVSQGIFIHYTNTETLESQELDITAE